MSSAPQNNNRNEKIKTILLIFIALSAALFVSLFLTRISLVQGDSMCPTLKDKSVLLISVNDNYGVGDIIVFKKSPSDSYTIVKRIVAVENDTVEIKDGVLFVNGEDRVFLGDTPDYTSATVPKDCFFVLGDNYSCSTDSRSNEIGFVKKESVLGKAIFRLFPSPSANFDYN